ncbi:MAG: hypothetical protein IPM66_16565 [Acidobacteriota bacterium]|nr:MAG: hypothetical protein IPM66_16565 [Acidobacteriota bacterium]
MKIQGLVKIFNQVKAQLQTGLTPGEVEPFRNRVMTVVRDVETICRRHGKSPDQLPAPSRIAYRFLKDLDLRNLPVRENGDDDSIKSGLRIKNIVKTGEYYVQLFWRSHRMLLESSDEMISLQDAIRSRVTLIEDLCGRHNATPAALEGASRQIFSWMKLLSNQENLFRHLEALRSAADVIETFRVRKKTPIEVRLINTNEIWQWRQYSNIFLLKVNQGFMGADRDVWRAIIHNSMIDVDPSNKHIINEYAASEEFNEVLIEMDSYVAKITDGGRGHIHNLDESFDRVNIAYFNGLMPKPRLVWNRTPTLRKFGHYQPNRDTVMISVSLDDAGVPAFVVDFVLYHELLHKKHGAMIVNGRRLVHSPAFRADERLFAAYPQATELISQLARRHRGV